MQKYCKNCESNTEYKTDLICDNCNNNDEQCLLVKIDDDNFYKKSYDCIFIEFDENGLYLAKHDEPEIGMSLLMSPFNMFFTWQTTQITKIHEIIIEGHYKIYRFDTNNSKYKLYKKI